MAGKALRQMYRKQVPLSIRTKDRCSSDLIKEKTSTMGDNSNAIRYADIKSTKLTPGGFDEKF